MHPPSPECSYTSGMASSLQGPPEEPPATAEPERFGPLVVRRLVKEDGRALILFSRAAGER